MLYDCVRVCICAHSNRDRTDVARLIFVCFGFSLDGGKKHILSCPSIAFTQRIRIKTDTFFVFSFLCVDIFFFFSVFFCFIRFFNNLFIVLSIVLIFHSDANEIENGILV